jgi:hypothetical protein
MSSEAYANSNLFNAESLFTEAQKDLLTLIFILGLDSSQLETITIDELVDKIKSSYDYRNADIILSSAGIDTNLQHGTTKFLRIECNSLTRRVRRSWFNKEFAKEVFENE